MNGEAGGAVVAAFDFDGTMTRGDTLLPFLRFVTGSLRFARDMTASAPLLAAYAAGLVRNDRAKTGVLRRCLGGMPIVRLGELGRRFAGERLPRRVRPEALARLAWHRGRGDRCVLVSASLQLYLEPWAAAAGFDDAVGSRLALDGDRVTGALDGGNCYGAEKVRRLEALLGPRQAFRLYAYGDSRGDRELLAWADRSWYRRMPPPGEA